jgi:hypothetical protein
MKTPVILTLLFVLCLTCATASAATTITGTTTVNPHIGNTYMVGGDGKLISLVNYNNATNTTYAKVVEFIKADKTDQNLYTSKYVCSDFAEDVHNNAERAGIKAAWVTIVFTNAPGHACNAFQTSDKGLVFIDCTGSPAQKGSFDKLVSLTVGKPLTPTSLYSPYYKWSTMGTVKSYKVYW